MNEIYLCMAAFLVVNLLAGLLRAYRGPTTADRLLAVQLFGTTTTAVMLLLAEELGMPALRDVALLFTLLAALLTVAFVRLPPRATQEREL